MSIFIYEKKNSSFLNCMLYLLIGAILFVSCAKDEETKPVIDKLKITSATSKAGNYEMELFANDSLFEGYNLLYFTLRNLGTDEMVQEAELNLFPLMDMMTMVHSAPYENPGSLADENDLFQGAVVFLMPSTPEMGWTIDVAVNEGGNADTVQLEIPKVVQLQEAKKINVISQIDDTKYFISLAEPREPQVGINNFELVVSYKKNMMSFPPATDLTIEIEPEMPSMDHGSPNNENPVHVSNGHYLGKVNFTMTGWWRIHLTIKKDGELVAADIYLDVTF